jgi:hypothetical protein
MAASDVPCDPARLAIRKTSRITMQTLQIDSAENAD